LGFLIWRHSYYGDWLPNTYYLKVYGIPLPLSRALSYLATFLRNYGVSLALAGLGLVLLWQRQVTLLMAGLGMGMGYIMLVGDDIFPYSRFLAYEVPVLLVLAITTVLRITSQPQPRLLLLSALSIGLLVNVGAFRLGDLTSTNGEPERGILAGVLINQYTDPETTIAVSAAGVVPYFSDRTTYDMLGKSDPVIARLAPVPGLSVGHNKYDFTYSLSREPDLVIIETSEKVINEWIRLAQGELSQAFRSRHFVALITNGVFQANYAQTFVDLPTLRQKNMIFANESGAIRANINNWQDPVIAP